VEVRARTLFYYESAVGYCPFAEWRNSIDDTVLKDAIAKRLLRLRLGLFGLYRVLNDGIIELKMDIGPGHRIYVAEWRRSIVVLLCGGDKHSQKKDIRLAERYWADFRRSNS